LPPCRAAPLGCSATTLGACFIGPYQKVPTNAKTQRSYPDFFVRRNGRLSKAESAQARATDRVFSRHLLARACKAPRLYRSPLRCAHPSNPTSNLSPAARFAPRQSALPNPCSRRANLIPPARPLAAAAAAAASAAATAAAAAAVLLKPYGRALRAVRRGRRARPSPP
jgi:hypothetical protein